MGGIHNLPVGHERDCPLVPLAGEEKQAVAINGKHRVQTGLPFMASDPGQEALRTQTLSCFHGPMSSCF